LASCYGSLTGYPIYRDEFNYQEDKKPGWIHGKPSFILSKSNEDILLNRSQDELLTENDIYTLNFVIMRLPAAKADKVRFRVIFLPTLKCKRIKF